MNTGGIHAARNEQELGWKALMSENEGYEYRSACSGTHNEAKCHIPKKILENINVLYLLLGQGKQKLRTLSNAQKHLEHSKD